MALRSVLSLLPDGVPCCQAGRWSALLVGVLYGSKHYNTLAAREVELREIEAKQKVIRDAQLAKERKALDRGTYTDLSLWGPRYDTDLCLWEPRYV